MAPSRRLSNGRSPYVNKQSQITSFFSTGGNSPQPSPQGSTPPLNTTRDPTPPHKPQGRKKAPLLIGHTPPPSSASKCEPSRAPFSDPVSKRARVFPADEEEEALAPRKGKAEVADEETPRSLRVLRRRVCVEEDHNDDDNDDEDDGGLGDDSSEDEDWGKSIGKKVEEEEEDDDDDAVELEEEEEVGRPRRGSKKTVQTRKRGKAASGGISGSAKKVRVDDGSGKKASPREALANGNATGAGLIEKTRTPHEVDTLLTGEAAERFGSREAEKFKFLLERRRDAKGQRPGDANYDPKTLYLPPDFLKSLSGGQRQWWEFKSKHMDKVLFFKMGKFYELFEMDAHVGAKELDLQYMKGEQPHCGFPEKNFSMNLEKLAKKGYRVLVIEQTETPEQLEIRRKEMGSKEKVVKREICAVVTKGTLVEGELMSTNADASYLMSLTEKCKNFENQGAATIGVCVVDVSTNKFMLGQFEDDSDRRCLCSMLAELRPVEIIKPSKVLSLETERVLLKHTRNPLVNDLVPLSEFWDAGKTIAEIKRMYELGFSGESPSTVDINTDSSKKELPGVLCDLIGSGDNGSYALSAFGGCLFYLRQALLDETLLKCAKFEQLSCSNVLDIVHKQYMILDAAAVENLEILENNKNGGPSGTLFAQLDHCVTAFGKRLLRSWLVRPLYDVTSVIERQDAIMELKGRSLASALQFRKELSRLPDMERLLARLFASCAASGRNSSKIILYEDAAKKHLKDFIATLCGCQSMIQACTTLSSILENSTSRLIHHLLMAGKGLPEVSPILKHFEDAFDWSEADQTGRIIPHEGADSEYDSACKAVKDIEVHLKRYLKEQRAELGDPSINYVTIGKDSYLLEVPEHLRNKVPRDYELQSSKKGFFRYWTPKIKTFLLELSQAESEKELKLKNILQRLMEQFSEHHLKWRQLVSITAEIDVLISLAVASDFYEGPSCRPHIKGEPDSEEITPILCCKSLGHPLLRSDSLGTGSFVPNDIRIGGNGGPRFILLSGPNMGGKSTLLRQVCLAVILAQIGADVPAESFELTPMDRIFVRMGAKDHIMSGQSTFLTELSETASMLLSATPRSLVALDELGRGTSTSDGQAIAESVLDYLTRTVCCQGMFSTHYHRLSVDFRKEPKVMLCHMACKVGGESGGVEEVTFLYKLTPGPCPKSYGVNVARLAGLPGSVLLKAAAKSSEFEASYGIQKPKSPTNLEDPGLDSMVSLIKEILDFTATRGCRKQSHGNSWRDLAQLQLRAQSLVQM